MQEQLSREPKAAQLGCPFFGNFLWANKESYSRTDLKNNYGVVEVLVRETIKKRVLLREKNNTKTKIHPQKQTAANSPSYHPNLLQHPMPQASLYP